MKPNRTVGLTLTGIKINNSSQKFAGSIQLSLYNQPGMLATISNLICQQKGNITNVKVTGRNTDFFELSLDVEVCSVEHLNTIITTLRTSENVHDVIRVKY